MDLSTFANPDLFTFTLFTILTKSSTDSDARDLNQGCSRLQMMAHTAQSAQAQLNQSSWQQHQHIYTLFLGALVQTRLQIQCRSFHSYRRQQSHCFPGSFSQYLTV